MLAYAQRRCVRQKRSLAAVFVVRNASIMPLSASHCDRTDAQFEKLAKQLSGLISWRQLDHFGGVNWTTHWIGVLIYEWHFTRSLLKDHSLLRMRTFNEDGSVPLNLTLSQRERGLAKKGGKR